MQLFGHSTADSSPRHRRLVMRRFLSPITATVVGLGLVATSVVAGLTVAPATSASADLGQPAAITLQKTVDDVHAITDGKPDDEFTYSIVVGCDDNECINAKMTDTLPAEFALFTLQSIMSTDTTDRPSTTTLTGCATGTPIGTDCRIDSTFTKKLGAGGALPVGIKDGDTYRIQVTLKVPASLSPTWPSNGDVVTNTAHATADNSAPAVDSADVTVTVPTTVAVTAGKTWSPSSQSFKPGASSTVTVTGASAANVPASELRIQDPQVADEGAATLDTTNPFRYVNFTALGASALPQGADRVEVDAYYYDGTTWGWVTGSAAAAAALPATVTDLTKVGGIRFVYTSTTGTTIVGGGTAASQAFTVAQRSTDRIGGGGLTGGFSAANKTDVALTVPGHAPVDKQANATLTVGALDVKVAASKTITPAEIPAGEPFSTALTAKNTSVGTLDTLTITEPKSGTFFGPKMMFDGFTGGADWAWPSGATGATFTWQYSDGSHSADIDLLETDLPPPTPAQTSGKYVSGFTIVYDGAIASGATAGIKFSTKTDADLIPTTVPVTPSQLFSNTVSVDGTNVAGTASKDATDTVRVYYPDIKLTLDKSISPAVATPGGTVVAKLKATTSATAIMVDPTTIVVQDGWDGTADTDFWDAYRAKSIAFTDIPDGSKLTVEYNIGTVATPNWQTLASDIPSTSAPYSATLPTPGSIIGLRFTYTDPSGFGQGTIVQPNVVFEASATLRSNGDATSVAADDPVKTVYHNVANAQGTGHAGTVPVTSDLVTAPATAGIITYTHSGGGVGDLLAGKQWVDADGSTDLTELNSQSGATAGTRLTWGVNTPGYESVTISDAEPGKETDAKNTVFQAFDLASVGAVSFSSDPLLKWDAVDTIELYYSGAWHTVSPSGGSWMNGTGFKGYTLSTTERANTTGVRVTVVENTAARSASSDPTAPAPNSGVASSTDGRVLPLFWNLRNALRIPGATNWVTDDVTYNGGKANVDNFMGVTGTLIGGGSVGPRLADDTVNLIDSVPGVNTSKTASVPSVIVPYFGDVAPGSYPTVDFTVDAWNTSSTRASYIRSADVVPCASPSTCLSAASDHGSDIFTGKSYDDSSTFERFTLTGVSFTVPSTVPVDKAASKVTLWLRDAAGTLTVQNTTMNGVVAMSTSALANVVGISVVYQSTDPATTGGLLPKGEHITMKLATRLRDTLRSDPSTPLAGSVTVTNTTYAQGFDPVTAPTDQPYATQQASVDLIDGKLDVTASKDISPNTILEAAPTTPVNVKLTATDGTSTVAAETATITDETAGFWSKFQLTGLGTVTRPAGAALVRVDVKVAGSWVQGAAAATAALPASVTDLTTVEGIRFVYENDPTKLFSSTVPSAGWNAEANFGVVLRSGATFPDSVDNTVKTEATHTGLPDAHQQADDTITLGAGSFALDVHKDLATHTLEPGIAVPWTLTFTNTGSGFLDITKVVDTLPAKLTWDGSAPTYSTSAGGTLATTGIDVTQPTADTIKFDWPSGGRMQPGESFVITLNIALEPGLTTAERATNQFVVSTVQTPLSCTNTGNTEGLLTGLAANECGTTNYAQPQAGALLFTQKGVKGEVDGTLVDGATNINDAALPCTPDSDGFFRTTCAADTVIGATDTWRVVSTNTGTVDYKKLTIVDPLPVPGDRLLATGASRGTGYRPVFDPTSLTITPSVAGATTSWEVTTAAAPCVSAGATTWPSDPTCSTHPSSASWTDHAAFAGDWADVTAIRIVLDFTSVPTDHVLKPGGTVTVLYDTKNTPGATADAVKTVVPAGAQFAWNQAGVTAALSTGGVISRAPSRTGVSIQTGPLEIAKALDGNATFLAPSTVDFDVACTVAGTPLDMGAYSTVTVAPGSSAIVPGIPLGAECKVQEHGPVGSYKETSRTAAKTVEILASATGSGATPAAQSVTFTNTYVAAPAITLAKDGVLAPGSKNAAGDTVDYTFAVVNTGNVALTDVHITDVLPGVSAVTFAAGFSGTLAPGESTTATATYTLTQADVDAGKVDNTATVVGTPPVGPKVDDTDPATVTVTPNPSVVLQKTSAFAPGGSLKKGDGVIYTFTASNTGNVTLTELQIVDEMPGLSAPVFSAWPSTPGKLLPGETVTTTATYTLTQADVDAGSLTNHAIVVATPPSGPKITGGSTSTISISPKPAVTLVKTGKFAPGSTGVVGDTVNYSFVATNIGNVTLTGLEITDAKPGLSAIHYDAWPHAKGLLAPGESVSATATYTLTAADVLSGTVNNSATVSAVGLVSAVPTKVSAVSGVKIAVPTGLAATGLTLMPPVLAMIVFILLGVGLILVARRRRHRLVD